MASRLRLGVSANSAWPQMLGLSGHTSTPSEVAEGEMINEKKKEREIGIHLVRESERMF